jgi:hypothetical protein
LKVYRQIRTDRHTTPGQRIAPVDDVRDDRGGRGGEVLGQQRQGLELNGAADRLNVGAWIDEWLCEVVVCGRQARPIDA